MIQLPCPKYSSLPMAASMVLLLLILAMINGSDAAWCVCRNDVSSTALQKTLDYACGAGADCNPIVQNGPCFNPNTVIAHCSYAANSYYQRKGQAQQACDFSGTAQLTNTDPSPAGCTFPAIPSAAGTASTTASSTGSSFNPNSASGGNGVLGSNSGSLGPSGVGLDANHANNNFLPNANMGFSLFVTFLVSALIALMRVF